MVFDLRFLPNPHFDEKLRPFNGKDEQIQNYVLSEDEGKNFEKHLHEFLLFSLPLYEKEGRYRLCVAFGCTGGKHRSVTIAERLAKVLKESNFNVALEHRHLFLE